MSKYDSVDGGIPATFRDGPKKGHTGVVTPQAGGAPPAELRFLDGMIYLRHRRRTFDAHDANGEKQSYRGVEYRIDEQCPFMVQMHQEVEKSLAELATDRVETLT